MYGGHFEVCGGSGEHVRDGDDDSGEVWHQSKREERQGIPDSGKTADLEHKIQSPDSPDLLDILTSNTTLLMLTGSQHLKDAAGKAVALYCATQEQDVTDKLQQLYSQYSLSKYTSTMLDMLIR